MNGKRHHSLRAMTLIELVLVMGLLATVLAISAPQLARFFSGRALAEEVRRFIALTRYGREQAISESVVMELWMDPEEGTYGLRPQIDYRSNPLDPIEFTLHRDLSFDIASDDLNKDNVARILFWPDGAIDDQSVQSILISEKDGPSVEIASDENRLCYQTVEGGSGDAY
jgi:hypothetical protein